MEINHESERAVLGELLYNNKLLQISNKYLTSNSFEHLNNKVIYEVIERQINDGQAIDVPILFEILSKNPKNPIEVWYISELPQLASQELFEEHCRIIVEKYIKRIIKRLSESLIVKCEDGDFDSLELLQYSQDSLAQIFNKLLYGKSHKIDELTLNVFDLIMKYQDGGVKAIPTMNRQINYLMRGGAMESQLIGVASRSGIGKTGFMIDWSLHCVKNGFNVAIYSLEQSVDQLLIRYIANEMEIDSYKLMAIKDKLVSEEINGLGESLSRFKKYNLWINDTSGWHIDSLVLDIKNNIIQNKINIVFIDYLQLINGQGGTRKNRENEITYVINKLKEVNKETKIPIVPLIQFNRAGDDKPTLKNLRESGGIEQALDVCIALYDKNADKNRSEKVINDFELIVIKNRDGACGNETVTYQKDCFKFKSKSSFPSPDEQFQIIGDYSDNGF